METSPLNLELGVSEKPSFAKLCSKTEAKGIYFWRNINPFCDIAPCFAKLLFQKKWKQETLLIRRGAKPLRPLLETMAQPFHTPIAKRVFFIQKQKNVGSVLLSVKIKLFFM